MQPAHSILTDMLKKQLVELQVLFYKAEHLAAHLDVRDVDVGRLATQMLRVLYAAHGSVQSFTAVPTGDPDDTEALPQGFQHMLAQLLQAIDYFFTRFVSDAESDSGSTGTHFPQGEMRRQHPLCVLFLDLCVFHDNTLCALRVPFYYFIAGAPSVFRLQRYIGCAQ